MIRIEPRERGRRTKRLDLARLLPPLKIVRRPQKPGRKPRDVVRIKP